jgi:hypothetical protein
MPNEITVLAKLTIQNDGTGQTFIGDTTKILSLATAGRKYASAQTVTGVAADIALGPMIDFNTVGVIWLKNQSTTAGEIIQVIKSGVVVGRIPPQEAYPWRPEPDGVAMQVKSLAGTPVLDTIASGTTT